MASIEHPRLPAPLRVEGAVEVSSPEFSFRIRFEADRIVVVFHRLPDLVRAARNLRKLRRGVEKSLRDHERRKGESSKLPAPATAAGGLPPFELQLRRRPFGRVDSTSKGLRFRPTLLRFFFPRRATSESV